MLMLLARLVARYWRPEAPSAPPVAPPPPVATTPHAERRQIEQRLSDAEARLATLQALAGLESFRSIPRREDRRDAR